MFLGHDAGCVRFLFVEKMVPTLQSVMFREHDTHLPMTTALSAAPDARHHSTPRRTLPRVSSLLSWVTSSSAQSAPTRLFSYKEHDELDAACALVRNWMENWPHGKWEVSDTCAPQGYSKRGIAIYVENPFKHECQVFLAAQPDYSSLLAADYPMLIRGFDDMKFVSLEKKIILKED